MPSSSAIRTGALILAASLQMSARTALSVEPPAVTAPPARFFELVAEGDRDVARGFYRKHIDADGLPIAAAEVVADAALQRAWVIVTRMLAGRPDVLKAMAKDGMYLVIIGKDQVYTDMPEYRNHPDPAFQNERVRGTGGKPTSFGEENLLSLPIDRYDDESIAVHEFAHTIDSALGTIDPSWNDRRDRLFRRAVEKDLFRNAYARSDAAEYWAEMVQAYFDCNRINNWNHGPVGTREQLRSYDPEGYAWVRDTFRLSPEQDWRYAFVQKLPNVIAPPARFRIDPYYTRFTWAREFPVIGRGAGDEALLKANDTIRRMFAYRHDVLKALIADGVRLVVLGKNERIADLPEYRSAADRTGIDALARTLDYRPELKLLVVAEENVLNDPARPRTGDSQLIGAFARAMLQVAGTRPADPNWDRRGREVQQYELRVRRLDVRFDEQLKTLFEQATARGQWKGTSAMHDRAAYWCRGVLAYFDAAGQDAAPPDAAHPICTREALSAYDPGLYSLVNETFAYAGRVDWRFRPAGK